ncbi:AraC family transcriptional regulator [Nocardia brasiliensis]|uniref:AraC family transcriptional regulator n=1 Tax=Nocardia brasiliensis TaxID=37326 RepID=UPI0024538B91|nr:helix-turn-helix domain-containing protein [Nocardia brasiliensis]
MTTSPPSPALPDSRRGRRDESARSSDAQGTKASLGLSDRTDNTAVAPRARRAGRRRSTPVGAVRASVPVIPAPRASVLLADAIEELIPAPESLRPWLTDLGHVPAVRELSEPFAHVPHATTTVVLRTGPWDALVVGPQTKASYPYPGKPTSCIRLRLAPGAIEPLLGVPAQAFTDRVVRLADLPGAAAGFAGELLKLAPEEVFGFLEEVIPQRISDDPARRAQRRLLWAAMQAMSAGRSVPETAAAIAVSERQLRNLFTAGIGVSPKHFARIARIRRLLARASDTAWNLAAPDRARSVVGGAPNQTMNRLGPTELPGTASSLARLAAAAGYDDQSKVQVPPTSLAHLAAEAGYYDQSHMTADFRALMGVPPTAFLRGVLPPPTPCRPLHRM